MTRSLLLAEQKGEQGRRFEHGLSHGRAGLQPTATLARDVYFDDPTGISSAIELGLIAAAKAAAGRPKAAARMIVRRGSGLFFLATKDPAIAPGEPIEI